MEMKTTKMLDPTSIPILIPNRQVRAHQNSVAQTLTVYAAFSNSIAQPALDRQKLDASPLWMAPRMTWIKPSWGWMMYRCGYGFKDPGQERVLALEMKVGDFERLLGFAWVASLQEKEDDEIEAENEMIQGSKGMQREKHYVQVQWDPERSPSLERLSCRSIQIGIPNAIKKRWVDEWILSIKDVTERARALKRALEEEPGLSTKKLMEMGLMPVETVVVLPDHLRERLGMD